MNSNVPPQAALKWDHTPESILTTAKQAIDTCRAIRDKVASLSAEKCNFITVFLPLALADDQFTATTQPVTFYENVSPDKAIRDASTEARKMTREFDVESLMRLDIYKALLSAKAKAEELSPEEQRLVDQMILNRKRAGLSLREDQRKEVTQLKKELSELRSEFMKNLNEGNGAITLTRDELEGIPEDVVKGYTPIEGTNNVSVALSSPEFFSLIEDAQIPEIRKRSYVAHENRLEVNIPLIERLIRLRRRCARLLGYETWADFTVEVRAAKNSQAVVNLLDDLEQKSLPIATKDLDNLLKLKEKEYAEKSLPFDGCFYSWDYPILRRRYSHIFTQQTLSLDRNLVKEYFPVDHVVPAMLDIYQNLLGVKFQEVEGNLWHSGVKQYAVWNNNAKDDNDFLGWAYFDLYPRDFKHSQPSMSPILPGFTNEKGERSYPAAAIIGSLARPSPGCPALMRHHDVVMLFHEIGHLFHELISVTRFGRFHGTIGPVDFGEAPSQMLENWCWEPEVLKRLSNHFEKNEPMPDDMIKNLIKSRHSNFGIFELQQVFMAKYDMRVHMQTDEGRPLSPELSIQEVNIIPHLVEIDYSKLWCQLREKTTLLKYGDVVTHALGEFSHMVGEYGAGYYSYAYSLVLAADMYKTVFKGAIFDTEKGKSAYPKARVRQRADLFTGKLYRDKILKPGATRDELDMLKDFLGREPNADAFLELILGGKD
ncbi:metallopeptidase MepB [Ceratobasidium sp. AG-Ba]|nr:metallopeptidase MepB [Ceratobasidium sp. AG-Ba]